MVTKHKRLKDLEESLEAGTITKEEYSSKKKEIEAMPEEEQKKSDSEKTDDDVKPTFRSDIMLIIIVAIVALAFAALFGFNKLSGNSEPLTIDDLHQLNLEGELDPEQGYVYNDIFSFVKFEDVWYTKLQSLSGLTEYNFNFRFGPRDVEDIEIEGFLNKELFNNATEYYVTFNPVGQDFGHIRLARFDFDTQMLNVFKKIPKSACDRDASNQTTACEGLPIVTCATSADDIIVYYQEAEEPKVEYSNNCIIIAGKELDFVKGVDRVLFNLYGIME